MLCVRETGLPLHQPSVWVLTELRGTNRASETIKQALRSVMVLYLALDAMKVNLAERLIAGELLSLSEIELLTRVCHATLEATCRPGASNVVPLRRKGVLGTFKATQVDPQTAGIRMRYIHQYLAWVVNERLLKIGATHATFIGLTELSKRVLEAFKARIPDSPSFDGLDAREGLSDADRSRLLSVISVDSPENPWKSAHARIRNYLLIRWLVSLGLRRGELLGIKVPDIRFRTNEVLIPRRADDIEDPRRNQPNAKTSDRLLAVDTDLMQLTRDYILKFRRAIVGARLHEFVWVANGTGAPLSLAGLNKVFVVLREKCPFLPDDLSAHVLRHTWNDQFSVEMDEADVSEADEHKMRTRLMGWSANSEMAIKYTRRHIKKKAAAASLALQAKFVVGEQDEI